MLTLCNDAYGGERAEGWVGFGGWKMGEKWVGSVGVPGFEDCCIGTPGLPAALLIVRHIGRLCRF